MADLGTLVPRILGRYAIAAAAHVGRLSYMGLEVVRGLREWRIWVPRAFQQAWHVGYGSLFIVLITAAFSGAVTALQAGYQLQTNIPLYFLAAVMVQSIILELGPVLTAMVLAGRIGARYAAELGTMRVTEQIDALESLGRSSVTHLVIPRVVAGTLLLPILVVFADFAGIVAAWYSATVGTLNITTAEFVYGARVFYRDWDLWYSMIKSLFFGLAITVVACYMGFSTQKGAEGVGRATTTAVVAASVLILFLDAALAKLLLE
ncbi:MAG: MlaE family ABC transporter permease [Gemmatimonadales bacterium]